MKLTGYSLVNTATQEVIINYGSMPAKVRIESMKLSVHSPSLGVIAKDHSLLERYQEDPGGDIRTGLTEDIQADKVVYTVRYRSETRPEKRGRMREAAINAEREKAQEDRLTNGATPEAIAYRQEIAGA